MRKNNQALPTCAHLSSGVGKPRDEARFTVFMSVPASFIQLPFTYSMKQLNSLPTLCTYFPPMSKLFNFFLPWKLHWTYCRSTLPSAIRSDSCTSSCTVYIFLQWHFDVKTKWCRFHNLVIYVLSSLCRLWRVVWGSPSSTPLLKIARWLPTLPSATLTPTLNVRRRWPDWTNDLDNKLITLISTTTGTYTSCMVHLHSMARSKAFLPQPCLMVCSSLLCYCFHIFH